MSFPFPLSKQPKDLEELRIKVLNNCARCIIGTTPVLLNDLGWQPHICSLLDELAVSFAADYKLYKLEEETLKVKLVDVAFFNQHISEFLKKGKNLDNLLGFELGKVESLYTMDHPLIANLQRILCTFLVSILDIY